MSMTRDVCSTRGYTLVPEAPPPHHVYDTEQAHARWYPLERPPMAPHPSGTTLVTVPQLGANLYGDDPTDPGRQTEPRTATAGMVARLNVNAGQRNVSHAGVRL
jgi:hypothetical protein